MLNSIRPILNHLEADPKWSHFRVMQAIQAIWPEVVGAVVANHTSPLRISRQILQVATSTPAWAQNLAFQRQLILTKLASRLSTPINDIRFLPADWHRSPRVFDSETAIAARPPGSSARQAAASAPPDTPEEALQRWMQRAKQAQRHMTQCPRCGHPCPQSELSRWSICGFCEVRSH